MRETRQRLRLRGHAKVWLPGLATLLLELTGDIYWADGDNDDVLTAGREMLAIRFEGHDRLQSKLEL